MSKNHTERILDILRESEEPMCYEEIKEKLGEPFNCGLLANLATKGTLTTVKRPYQQKRADGTTRMVTRSMYGFHVPQETPESVLLVIRGRPIKTPPGARVHRMKDHEPAATRLSA